jgi:hypothetical protein
VRVVRVADGRTTAIAPRGRGRVFAQLEPPGLFVGYTLAAGPRPGRVDFVPGAALTRDLVPPG